MTFSRVELRFFHYGQRLLEDHKTVVSLDLITGPGLQHAQAYMDQMFLRLCQAARLHRSDQVNCRIDAIDETTGQTITFYPPPK